MTANRIKTTQVLIELFSGLLALLFLYTSMSKFLDFKESTGAMLNQPFPKWLGYGLAWAVPITELLIVIAFVISAFKFEKLRTISLWASFVLMSLFTIYIAAILLHFFDKIPCSCGGGIRQLTWGQHLLFNLFFVLIALVAIILRKKETTKEQPYADTQPNLQSAII